LFPAADGGRINIDNFRSREWTPALKAADVEHLRIYDMRHTFATWNLAAGMSIFTLSRRTGTSVQMIDAAYGRLARGAEDQDRALLDAYEWPRSAVGTLWARFPRQPRTRTFPRTTKAPRLQGFLWSAPERIRTSDLRFRSLLLRVALRRIRLCRAT
jgi:hypothetical protein